MVSELLTREEAAEYLRRHFGFKIAAATLAVYATASSHMRGPRYQRAGRAVIYRREWLDEWAEERLSPPVRSTSELRESA